MEKPEVNVRYLSLSLPLYFVRQGLSLNLGGHWFGLTGHPSSPKDSAVSTSPAGIRRVDYGSLFCCFFFFLQVLGLNVGPHIGMTIALLTGSSCQLPLTLFLPHIEFCCLWKLAKLEHQSQNFHLNLFGPIPTFPSALLLTLIVSTVSLSRQHFPFSSSFPAWYRLKFQVVLPSRYHVLLPLNRFHSIIYSWWKCLLLILLFHSSRLLFEL